MRHYKPFGFKYKHLETGRLFFLTDILIVLRLFRFSDFDTIMYAILAVVVQHYV